MQMHKYINLLLGGTAILLLEGGITLLLLLFWSVAFVTGCALGIENFSWFSIKNDKTLCDSK